MFSLMHVSPSGGSASGEMTIQEALDYITASNEDNIVETIALFALHALAKTNPKAVYDVLDACTGGDWMSGGSE